MLIPEDLRRDLEDQMKSDGYEQLGPYIRFIVKKFLKEKRDDQSRRK